MTTSTKNASTSPSKISKTYPHYTPNLLVLPQADLTRTKSKFILLQNVPYESLLSSSSLGSGNGDGDGDGNSSKRNHAHLVATKDQASLIDVKGNAYALTTMGTSNCWIVWKNENEIENESTNDEPLAKKLKTAACTTSAASACESQTQTQTQTQQQQSVRLIHPGGSGSSFWSACSKPPLTKQEVTRVLKAKSAKFSKNNQYVKAKAKTNRYRYYSTSQLALKLQYSRPQVQDVLNTLYCIPVPVANTEIDDRDTEDTDTDDFHWQLTQDEELIANCKAAVVQTVAEEQDLLTLQDLPLEQISQQQVLPRLKQSSIVATEIPNASLWATKFVELASIRIINSTSKSKSKSKLKSKSNVQFQFNPDTIALWVVQELLQSLLLCSSTTTTSTTTLMMMQEQESKTDVDQDESSLTLDDFLSKVESRLPLTEEYESIVNLEWLLQKQQEELLSSQVLFTKEKIMVLCNENMNGNVNGGSLKEVV